MFSKVYFAGYEGNLEGRYHIPSTSAYPAVLILPPDPTYGGSIDNDVILAIENSFVECGFATLTFNYRGVGNSASVFRCVADALQDANVALDWFENLCRGATHFWVVGYSFGCWVGSNVVMRRPEVEGFIFVSPMFKKQDFSIMYPTLCSGLVITGAKDEFTQVELVDECVKKITNFNNFPVKLELIEDAGHLYKGKIDRLRQVIVEYVNLFLALRIEKPVRKKRRKRKKKDTLM